MEKKAGKQRKVADRGGKEVPNWETTSYFIARGLFGAMTVIARRATVMNALSKAFLITIVCIVASLLRTLQNTNRIELRFRTRLPNGALEVEIV